MGLPTVAFVAVLAVAGFVVTLRDPDTFSSFSGRHTSEVAADGIERGCHLLDPQFCHGVDDSPFSSDPMGTGSVLACESDLGNGHLIEVWQDPLLHWYLHWDLARLADSDHPLDSYWIAAWTQDATWAHAIHVGGVRTGWAEFPLPPGNDRLVTVRAGFIALGGVLKEGLHSLKASPLDVHPDGTVRLAAFVNGDQLVLEIPTHPTYDVAQPPEALHFVQANPVGLASRCAPS